MATLSAQSPSSDSLPTYSRSTVPTYLNDTNPSASRAQQEHAYHLVKNGKQWLTLGFRSQARNTDQLPYFNQGYPISGSVKLNLSNEAIIRSVSVSVIGEVISPAYYSRFLTITRKLFVSNVNEIDSSAPDPPTISEGKLNGEHTWPFLIELPKGVCVVLSDDARHNFRLPPTLSNDACKTQIRYKLIARVKKGILSSDNRLTTEIAYTPLLRPSLPSILRQIANLENQPLIGPEGDPEGWKTLDSVILCGKVFNTRGIEATCVLSISRPLCYARGTIIPLILTISSSDAQALDLLSSPTSPTVQLIRHASFSLHISTNAMTLVSPRDSHPEMIRTAIWWPVQESDGDRGHRRVLYGVIRIPGDVPPSCRIMNFHHQYTITLFDFKAVGFTPAGVEGRRGPLLSVPVEIVTVPAQSLQVTAYQPPMYDASL